MAKKTEKSITPDKGEIVLYQSPDGKSAWEAVHSAIVTVKP